jgi:hypothetical protein
MSLFHLYAARQIVPAQVLRPGPRGWTLLLVFLLFPIAVRYRKPPDVVGLSSAPRWVSRRSSTSLRAATISGTEQHAAGPRRYLLRRDVRAARAGGRAPHVGWIMLFVIGLFLAYGLSRAVAPGQWAHRGYDVSSLSGFMYQTLEGIFGTAVDVSSSLIILFTIYGAFLQHSGAGKFYLDWSFAAMGSKHSGRGRTVVLASFLLGGPSGSGVATTVTIGSVAYPMLERAGYGKDAAGGLLAAGGLGAIISPPVLGRAAFLIAEFLKISYLDVLLMATIPTLLYYLSLFLMVELDTRKFGLPNVAVAVEGQLALLTKRYWYHFVSLVAIVAVHGLGLLADARGLLGDRRHVRGVVAASRHGDWAGAKSSPRCATAPARC